MNQDQIIGANIKGIRTKIGLTQEALAAHLGITREEVSYYETGKRTLSTRALTKIASLFGVDEYDLYEADAENQAAILSFAFRADNLPEESMSDVAEFRKIVMNYINMKRACKDVETATTNNRKQE